MKTTTTGESSISSFSLDRSTLTQRKPAWTHEGRRFTQADVCGYEIEGRRFVVKDFRPRPWLVRWFLGRWVLRREWERLERLQGIRGIPRLLGWIDADAFAMEWIEGDRLPHRKHGSLDPVCFDRLAELVAAMHERGVSHGDLRRTNVLLDAGQQPYLIDFATAALAGAGGHKRSFFKRVCDVDRLTVLKLKAYYCPGALTEEERHRLEEQPVSLRVGRFLRKKVYRPFKPRHMQRRWARWRTILFGKKED